MWFRKASARRQAIREDVAEIESLSSEARGYRGHIFLISAFFFVIAAAVQFWPGGGGGAGGTGGAGVLPYREGERASTTIRSPVSFAFGDPVTMQRRQENERAMSPPVIVETPEGMNRVAHQLIALKQDVQAARSLAEVPPAERERFPGLTDPVMRQLQGLDAGMYQTIVESVEKTVLREMPLVSPGDYQTLAGRKLAAGRVAVAAGSGSVGENVADTLLRDVLVVGAVTPAQRAALKAALSKDMSQGIAELTAGYLSSAAAEPTYAYDAKLSAQLADYGASRVKEGDEQILKNDVLVAAGEVITARMQQELAAAQRELEKESLRKNPWAIWLSAAGRALTVLLLTVLGALYVVRMNVGAAAGAGGGVTGGGGGATTLGQGWAVCGLLLIALVVARAVVGYWPQSAYLSGIAPTLLAGIILVIAYNQRFGLGMAALHGLLVTITLGMGLDFYLAMLAGIAVFSFGLREIRRRGKLIEIGLFAGMAVFVTVWALGLARVIGSIWDPWIVSTDLGVVAVESLWGAAGGMLVAMVISAILPPVERVFKITTAMTLLELCDANKPLLRRLQQEAPGTFNHSLTVGIMAEAAGNAIGVNGLLCRAGSYYHDVGKLSKPQYFIENQTGGAPNRHEKLSPAMSLLIIVGHVKDGIELAREYKLPWVIHQFIGQHHGTTLVEYFFHAAKKRQQAVGEGDHAEVSETEFRYPGPKPQTREAAVVMICDACESIVRSIDEPTPGRIEAAVHTLIEKRLMDGQFNECDLTLRQLSVIEEKLTRTLAGIHHGRVAYPGNAGSAGMGDSPAAMMKPA